MVITPEYAAEVLGRVNGDKAHVAYVLRATVEQIDLALSGQPVRVADAYDSLWADSHERKSRLISAMGGSCLICGFNQYRSAMDFHHVRGKTGHMSTLLQNSFPKAVAEAKRCVLLCANCHRAVTWKDIEIPEQTIEQSIRDNTPRLDALLVRR